MNARFVTGAVGGALAAGLGITALMIAGEKGSGKPSELVKLRRAGARQLGRPSRGGEGLPSAGEQASAQGGHLALSALAGLAYAAMADEDTAVLPGGLAFGLGFYVLAHGVAGPALGLKKPEWDQPAGAVGMHLVNHALFGLAIAGGARAALRD